MSAKIKRYLRNDSVTREQAWRLVEWCFARGGNGFTIRFLTTGDVSSPLYNKWLSDLAPFRRAPVTRDKSAVDIWKLCPDSIALLHRQLPQGLLTYHPSASEGWFEDFTILRQTDIMLEVVSHESLSVLSLTETEHRELAESGVTTHETAKSAQLTADH